MFPFPPESAETPPRAITASPFQLEWMGASDVDYINIWISTSSTTSEDEEEDKKEGNYFVIGENQSTPRGVYPNVIDFGVNFRNKRETTARM